MLKWFFLRDDCDILRNLFLEHHMLPNEGSIHSNNSRRMNAAAACVLSPLFPVLSSNSVTKSFISDFRVTMSYLARHRGRSGHLSLCVLSSDRQFAYFAFRIFVFCIFAYFWTFFTSCFVVRSSICIFCALMLLISVWNFR